MYYKTEWKSPIDFGKKKLLAAILWIKYENACTRHNFIHKNPIDLV